MIDWNKVQNNAAYLTKSVEWMSNNIDKVSPHDVDKMRDILEIIVLQADEIQRLTKLLD